MWMFVRERGEGESGAHDTSVDELLLLVGGDAQGGVSEHVDAAKHATGELVQHSEGVRGEQRSARARVFDALVHVGDRLLGGRRYDLDLVADARQQRAVQAKLEPLAELGEADEHDRDHGLRVPLEVGEEVQGAERAIRHQVGFIEDAHGVDTLPGERREVVLDRGVERGRHQLALDPEREADLLVEVAFPK
jgi:hypothetical protein